MLKQAGFVASAVAGLMMIGSAAFACTDCDDEWGGPSDFPGHHDGQVGVVNVDNVDVAENVNIPVCATNNTIAGGVVAVAVNALNPTYIDRCVKGVVHTGDEIDD
ncbi:hypothetical protein SAMN05192558_106129 [Actinokineospora alba]|uniref:Secreted protein n=1 Tax=Actinokineospora alba TaxID=504798 RepID=A0A1H0PJ09_9PSEU|nr:hypothetical protein [Actinokineospora alba]TDP65805.1 hypothetical protein C8E96_1296 [Actinokineospora alba]SDI64697.1 hypothetical protein SAMN05421871_106323 [Actinokineospora alba]SDP04635.1 hypothetical protein SAMN05192558_106129 [Actinokineospora alba]